MGDFEQKRSSRSRKFTMLERKALCSVSVVGLVNIHHEIFFIVVFIIIPLLWLVWNKRMIKVFDAAFKKTRKAFPWILGLPICCLLTNYRSHVIASSYRHTTCFLLRFPANNGIGHRGARSIGLARVKHQSDSKSRRLLAETSKRNKPQERAFPVLYSCWLHNLGKTPFAKKKPRNNSAACLGTKGADCFGLRSPTEVASCCTPPEPRCAIASLESTHKRIWEVGLGLFATSKATLRCHSMGFITGFHLVFLRCRIAYTWCNHIKKAVFTVLLTKAKVSSLAVLPETINWERIRPVKLKTPNQENRNQGNKGMLATMEFHRKIFVKKTYQWRSI